MAGGRSRAGPEDRGFGPRAHDSRAVANTPALAAPTRCGIELIHPDWPAPQPVRAVTTTRRGGVSVAPFDHLNLSGDVGDRADAVGENRRRLALRLGLPGPPRWLRQVHGTAVVSADAAPERPVADVCVADGPGGVCVVLTADCVPVLLCERHGRRVAAVHGGWRGLAAGVIGAGLAAMRSPPRDIMAWIGPAIGPGAYEVGNEVRQAFVDRDRAAGTAFAPSPTGRWLADLCAIARLELCRGGVESIHGCGHCTYTDTARFYSYRRDGVTGRMASLIWLAE